MEAVQSWLRSQPKEGSAVGIRRLLESWTKCIAKQGQCIDVLTFFQLCIKPADVRKNKSLGQI
jgi:hypothetical protein